MRAVFAFMLLGVLQAAPAAATTLFPVTAPRLPLDGMSPGELCRPAIAAAERASGIPDRLLQAIGRVESGRRDPASGAWVPWPWTVNAEGRGYFLESKAQAIALVGNLRARGVASIDVGCMQVNLMHHPHAFASLDQAFDPQANAAYAARFLTDLHAQANDWQRAAGWYHSVTPDLAADYQHKVASALAAEQRLPMPGPPVQAASLVPAVPLRPAFGAVPLMPSRMPRAHIIPLAASPGGGVPAGRSLAAYRAAPVALAVRFPGRGVN